MSIKIDEQLNTSVAVNEENVLASGAGKNVENLKIRRLAAGNHDVPEDQPDAIAQALVAWLRGIER